MAEEFMSEEELIKMLGIVKQTARRWRLKKYIPYYKVGKQILYKKSEIEEWLKDKRV